MTSSVDVFRAAMETVQAEGRKNRHRWSRAEGVECALAAEALRKLVELLEARDPGALITGPAEVGVPLAQSAASRPQLALLCPCGEPITGAGFKGECGPYCSRSRCRCPRWCTQACHDRAAEHQAQRGEA